MSVIDDLVGECRKFLQMVLFIVRISYYCSNLVFSSHFELWIAFFHHTQRSSGFRVISYWKDLLLTFKEICCGFFREAVEQPGWCPDPHKPPCAG